MPSPDIDNWSLRQYCTVSHSVMSDSLQPWHCSLQAASAMAFPRREYWSGLPCPLPGDLPDPGIEPASPALAGGFFTTSAAWEMILILSLFRILIFLSNV